MHASVPKIKNGVYYQPQLMTEQSTEARDLSRLPRQEQRATAEVIRLLPQDSVSMRYMDGKLGVTMNNEQIDTELQKSWSSNWDRFVRMY
jgi:hypothetical protein